MWMRWWTSTRRPSASDRHGDARRWVPRLRGKQPTPCRTRHLATSAYGHTLHACAHHKAHGRRGRSESNDKGESRPQSPHARLHIPPPNAKTPTVILIHSSLLANSLKTTRSLMHKTTTPQVHHLLGGNPRVTASVLRAVHARSEGCLVAADASGHTPLDRHFAARGVLDPLRDPVVASLCRMPG